MQLFWIRLRVVILIVAFIDFCFMFPFHYITAERHCRTPQCNPHIQTLFCSFDIRKPGRSSWRSAECYVFSGLHLYGAIFSANAACVAYKKKQEAQLSPRDRAMRRVSWNLANCHATVQKLLVQQVLNQLIRATKSCCRQRLAICAINYSGRASELGSIIDLHVHCSWPTTAQFITLWASTFLELSW